MDGWLLATNCALPCLSDGQEDDGPDATARARRLDWTALLKRTFLVDVLTCPELLEPDGDHRDRIDQEETARKILELASQPPPQTAPRPQTRAPDPVDEPSLID